MEAKRGWHNTGGNGLAREVWIHHIGDRTAEVRVMPRHCLAVIWHDHKAVAGEPFQTLVAAKLYADRQLAALA